MIKIEMGRVTLGKLRFFLAKHYGTICETETGSFETEDGFKVEIRPGSVTIEVPETENEETLRKTEVQQ